MSQTLEQKRTVFALAAIEKAKEKKGEDYGRHVRKLPAMILNNGLGTGFGLFIGRC